MKPSHWLINLSLLAGLLLGTTQLVLAWRCIQPSQVISPQKSPPASGQGQLAYSAHQDGNWDIYLIDADGSNQDRLTSNPANDRFPAWSPDGTQIAFYSERDQNQEIYVMDADGCNVRRLTNDPANDLMPAWSPDGTQIAFASERSGKSDIYVMQVDGSQVRQLTDSAAIDLQPNWSPDGKHIAFFSDQDKTSPECQETCWDIYVMNVDGSNLSRLTDYDGIDALPVWSPDGRHIAFSSARNGPTSIYMMDADGANLQPVTDVPGGHPAWSPDGTQIAFVGAAQDTPAIYVVNLENQEVRYLTDGAFPAWRPAFQ